MQRWTGEITISGRAGGRASTNECAKFYRAAPFGKSGLKSMIKSSRRAGPPPPSALFGSCSASLLLAKRTCRPPASISPASIFKRTIGTNRISAHLCKRERARRPLAIVRSRYANWHNWPPPPPTSASAPAIRQRRASARKQSSQSFRTKLLPKLTSPPGEFTVTQERPERAAAAAAGAALVADHLHIDWRTRWSV